MSRKKATKKKKPVKEDAGLVKIEKARMDRYEERSKIEPLKFKKMDGRDHLDIVDCTDKKLLKVRLSEAFGTADHDLQGYLTNQILQVFGGVLSIDDCDYDEAATATNQAMAIFAGIQPRDEIEALLVAQMIGIHNMSMACARRAMISNQNPIGRENNINMATKLTRTYVAQMQALKNYRQGGQQKMTVEHVHVNEGGQAIVGQVNQGGTKKNENRE